MMNSIAASPATGLILSIDANREILFQSVALWDNIITLPKLWREICLVFFMSREHIHPKLTLLRTARRTKTTNDRLLFGRANRGFFDVSDRAKHLFEADQIFGFVRWRGDAYGTQTWRVVVAKAGMPDEKLTRIPGVKPGAHLLLHAFGKVRSKRALRAIDVLSDKHVLHQIHSSYWRHVHLQIVKNLPLEPYDPEAHAALDRARSVK